MKKIIILLLLILFQGFFICYSIANNMTWQGYYNNGINSYNQKNYKTAIKNFTNAIKLNPNYVDSYINRGLAYYRLKNYDKSIEDFSSAIQINPQNKNLYFNRGIVKNNKGDFYGAIADFSIVLQLDPQNGKCYLYRGDNYYRIKKYFSALEDYKKASDIQNSKEALLRIISLHADFRDFKFIKTNFKDIIAELGYIQSFILLFCIIILFFTNTTKKSASFKEYGQSYISKKIHIDNININTQPPIPEEFNLDRNRIDYLEKIYQQTRKEHPFKSNHESGSTIYLSIVLSFFFVSFIYKILTMYFYIINEDWLLVIAFCISVTIIYFTLKKLPKLFESEPNITLNESQTYLLYKGALELYNKKIATIKDAEEKRRQKIREEEERKLKQQRSYWQNYWNEVQKDGFAFEKEVGNLYKEMGYKVTVTQGTGDGGVDLILSKDGETTIVQCKAHSHQVGPEPVRALWGVREDFNATKAIFVAYSGITTGAWKFARSKNMVILDANGLINLSLELNKTKQISEKNYSKKEATDNTGNNSIWLTIKDEIFGIHGRKCINCGTTENVDVHHKIPLSEGGTNCLDNLIPLCRTCHEELHRFKMSTFGPETKIDNQYGNTISNNKKSLIGYKICDAVEHGYRIKIKYKSGKANYENITERIIQPLEIKLGCECKNDLVYNSKYDQYKKFVRAFCELRNEERLFRIDRIIDVIEEYKS